jgi:8-oxo-dGTP pyrophosphatase MutT (NUDIX family)
MKPARRFVGTKRAVVAMLLRPSSSTTTSTTKQTQPTPITPNNSSFPPPVEVLPDDFFQDAIQTSLDGLPEGSIKPNMDMFFIVRADNERDRWSGQVGFPGGRQEKGENDLQTVQREVWEEIGLLLHVPDGKLNHLLISTNKETSFVLLGRIHDRVIRQGNDLLVVACMVFLQRTVQTPMMKLAPKEVAFGGWCPITELLRPNVGQPLILSLERSLFASTYPRLTKLVSYIGLSELSFTKVPLPVIDIVKSNSTITTDVATSRFILWGMTLGMVNDALHDMTRLRNWRISLSQPGQVETIFTSSLHNYGVHIIRIVYKKVKGKSATWAEYVRLYLLSAGFITILVPTGVIVEIGRRSLL